MPFLFVCHSYLLEKVLLELGQMLIYQLMVINNCCEHTSIVEFIIIISLQVNNFDSDACSILFSHPEVFCLTHEYHVKWI